MEYMTESLMVILAMIAIMFVYFFFKSVLFHRLVTKRIDYTEVNYVTAEKMIQGGWELALPEEDYNFVPNMVCLEMRTKRWE